MGRSEISRNVRSSGWNHQLPLVALVWEQNSSIPNGTLYKRRFYRESCSDYLSHASYRSLFTFMLFAPLCHCFFGQLLNLWQLKWLRLSDSLLQTHLLLASVDKSRRQLSWINCTNFWHQPNDPTRQNFCFAVLKVDPPMQPAWMSSKPITANSFGTWTPTCFNWRIDSVATRSFSPDSPRSIIHLLSNRFDAPAPLLLH